MEIKGITGLSVTLILALALGAAAEPAPAAAGEGCGITAIDRPASTVLVAASGDATTAPPPSFGTAGAIPASDSLLAQRGGPAVLCDAAAEARALEDAKQARNCRAGCETQCSRVSACRYSCTCHGADCGLKQPGAGGHIETLPSN